MIVFYLRDCDPGDEDEDTEQPESMVMFQDREVSNPTVRVSTDAGDVVFEDKE